MKTEFKKILMMTLLLLSAAASANAQTGESFEIVPFNNPGLTVDLGVGLWGIPIPTDYDGDGVTDLLVSCPDKPYKGLYYFRNVGTLDEPVFDKAVKVRNEGYNNIKLSVVGDKEYLMSAGKEWRNFRDRLYDEPQEIAYSGEVLGATYKKSRSNMWSYADWDGDGDKDIIVGIDTWDDYGWDDAYNSKGEWTRGPLHGYVYLLENVDGEYVNKGKVTAGGKVIDTYGAPNPCVADFNGDGLPDIICGEFVDGLTWYRNVGRKGAPEFKEGVQLADKDGEEIRFHLQMIVPVAYDFDKDGNTDLIVGDEDGRVAYVRNTGKVRKGVPQFDAPVYFRQKADMVKFGALATVWSVDWDNDGFEDLIAGNSAGEIAFIRNLSGGARPKWAEPELFEVDGRAFRVMAGENGSIQGPAERKWGYTVLSVADWDGDGFKDIIFNSIWGKIQWLRNKGEDNLLAMEAPRDVKVDYGEEEMPVVKWNWWKPAAGTLATQWRTTPVVIDWNQDGIDDIVMLDTEGYLALYEGGRTSEGEHFVKGGRRVFHATNCSLFDSLRGAVDAAPGELRLNNATAGASGRRKICFADWDGDGRQDLFVDSQNVAFFRNVEDKDGRTYFEYKGNLSGFSFRGHTVSPTPVDWNQDGRQDMLLGAEDGHFYLFLNIF